MNRLHIFFGLLLLFQCKQKPSESIGTVKKFIEGDLTSFTYDSQGRLTEERKKSYFKAGAVPDSLKTVLTYFYDEKGRKVKVQESSTLNDIWSTTFFFYDNKDSLLAEYSVDKSGDTTLLVEQGYNQDGSTKVTKRRQLLNNQSENDILKGKSRYDTLFTLTENFYQNGLLKKSIDRNNRKAIVAERVYEYEGNTLTQMKVYEFLGNKKQLLVTNHYLPKDKTPKFERLTINFLGDTIGIKKTEKDNKGRITKSIEFDTEMGLIFITNFDEKGQVSTESEIIKIAGEKTTRFFTYDSSGRKIKVVSIDEPLTEKEKKVL